MERNRVILHHLGICPERGGDEVRMKIFLRELNAEERIRLKRESGKRDYKPPYYHKERYECPCAASCGAVREKPDACPVFGQFRYADYME